MTRARGCVLRQAPTCSNYLPLKFTLLPAKLKQAGYETHMVGKGHLGYQTTDHLPVNRGFVSDTTFQHSLLLASVSGLRVSLLLPGRAFFALSCV